VLKTIAAAGLAIGLTLSPLAAFAQSDTGAPMSDKPMAAKTMAPKKPMMKSNMHSDTMKSGEMQQKM
jgi:hypothetical protein